MRAVVVTSASEKFFSAGADVSAFAAASGKSRFMTALLAHETFRKMENSPLLFIAAIAGHCLGGGFELALACDLRFAAEGAYQIGLPEANLGLFPGSGGTQRLPRLVGLARAKEIIYSGRMVPAKEALDIGLVDAVFPADQVYQRAALAARDYAKGPTAALRAAKMAMNWGTNTELRTGLVIERETFADLFATDDQKEGMRAFVAKEQPRFTGR